MQQAIMDAFAENIANTPPMPAALKLEALRSGNGTADDMPNGKTSEKANGKAD